MSWLLYAFLAQALWGVSFHIDKYLIVRYLRGSRVGSLVIFTGLTGFVFAFFIFLLNPGVLGIPPAHALIMTFNGALVVASFIPYLYALEQGETSIIVPMFQMIPAFVYVMGYIFLGEKLSELQIIASILIILGAITLSLDLTEIKPKFNKRIFFFMVLTAVMIATNVTVFKVIALEDSFWVTSFWEYVGFSALGLALLVFIGSWREQFINVIRQNKARVLGLNAFNEIINIIAKLIMNFVGLFVPLALVSVIGGVQPFFVFFYGIILTLFFPKIAKEKISRKFLFQKFIAMAVIFIGVYLLFRI